MSETAGAGRTGAGLAGRRALVTGASSGLGAHFARLLAAEGATVTLAARRLGPMEALAAEIAAAGGTAEPLALDVADAAAVAAALEGRVFDIVLNNAGVTASVAALDHDAATIDRIVDTNLKGAFHVARAVAPGMRAAGGGSIVNVASEAALVGIPGQLAYNVSKAALIAMTRSLAVDLAADRITVNCVCPGTTLTPLVEEAVARSPEPEQRLHQLGAIRPAGRLGTPEEIAGAIVYFAADHARYTTGAVLSVDGGYTAQ